MDAWFQQKALKFERGRNSEKVVWQCIKDIRKGRREVEPVRATVVKDENDNTCTITVAQQERDERDTSANPESDLNVKDWAK